MKEKAIPVLLQKQDIKDHLDKDSPLYQATLCHLPIQFVLGSHQADPEDKSFCFVPMYAYSRGKIRYAIGYYRLKQADFADACLDNGAIDIGKIGNPIFLNHIGKKKHRFNLKFVSEFLDMKNPAHSKKVRGVRITLKDHFETEECADTPPDGENEKEEKDEKETQEEEETDLFHIHRPVKSEIPTEESLYEKRSAKMMPLLPEETEEMMEKQQTAFRKDPPKDASWVSHFMQDENYTLDETKDILEAIVLALEDQGWTTTVERLRKAVAQLTTQTQFQEELELFRSLHFSLDRITEDKQLIQERVNTVRKHLASSSLSEIDRDALEEEKKRIDASRQTMTNEEERVKDQINCWVPTMSTHETFESYRESIRQTRHPLHPSLLQLLEKLLQIRLFVFNETQHKEAPDFVINMISRPEPHPVRFYILLAINTGKTHLIRYKSRSTLTFSELPYAIKARISTRCMEDPAYSMPEFKKWKEDLGIVDPNPEPRYDITGPLRDESVRFIVAANAPIHIPVGFPYLDIEQVPWPRMAEFIRLNQMPPDWRRRMSDEDTTAPFQLDNHKWDSVRHFMLAWPYKEKLTTYIKWTAGQEYSKNTKSKAFRQAVKESKAEANQATEQDRLRALEAKISQNEDVRRILIATRDSSLLSFQRGQPVEPDLMLMNLRTNGKFLSL